MFVKHDLSARMVRLQPAPLIRRLLAVAVLALVAAVRPSPAGAVGPTLLMDVETGRVLHAIDPFKRWYAASLTKMMTAYLTLRALETGRTTPSTPISITRRALAEPPSKLGLPLGTGIEIQHALAVLMVKSANDVAHALAAAVSGSPAQFIAEMNAAARELGMTDTRFVNAHGLPGEGQYTTARDMAILARTLLLKTYPQGHPLHALREHLFHLRAVTVAGSRMKNTNGLIGHFPGVTGLKTGYICSAGYNLAASAERGGRKLVAIVFGASSDDRRTEIAAALLEQGFAMPRNGNYRRLSELAPTTRPNPEPADLRPLVCPRKKLTKEQRATLNHVDPSINLELGRKVLEAAKAAAKAKAKSGTGDTTVASAFAATNREDPSDLVVAVTIYPYRVPPPKRRPILASDTIRKPAGPAEKKTARPKARRPNAARQASPGKKVIRSQRRPDVAKTGGPVNLSPIGDALAQ